MHGWRWVWQTTGGGNGIDGGVGDGVGGTVVTIGLTTINENRQQL
jgi:hypothetical protein